MAKGKEVAPVEEPKALALAGIEVAGGDSWDDYRGETGTEDIDSKDVNIPRLKLCQALSKEVKDRLAQEGDMINSVTKEIICPRGSKFLVIPICYSKEYILWRPQEDGGGILARARKAILPDGTVRYKWDKPNQSFEVK